MNNRVRVLLHGLILILGLALVVGGIVAAKYGAVVIGIIVAGVSMQRYLTTNKDERLGHAP